MRRTTSGPKRRMRRCVPDQPGTTPRPVSGMPRRVAGSAIRISAHAASSRPPPRAWPPSAAISGTRSAAMREKTRWPTRTQSKPNSCGSSAAQARMSPPVEKALPAPVMTAARAAWLPSISPQAASSESSMSSSSALSVSGRKMVMSATGPSQVSATRGSGMNMVPLRFGGKGEADRFGREQPRFHRLQGVGNEQREFGLGEAIAGKICAGRDFGDDEAGGRELHHAAFGDVGYVLPLLDATAARESDVLDLVHQLLDLAFALDDELAGLDRKLGAGVEHAREHDAFGAAGDVDEAAGTGRHVRADAEARNVDRAVPIDLQERQQRGVDAAALEIGELVGRGHER